MWSTDRRVVHRLVHMMPQTDDNDNESMRMLISYITLWVLIVDRVTELQGPLWRYTTTTTAVQRPVFEDNLGKPVPEK